MFTHLAVTRCMYIAPCVGAQRQRRSLVPDTATSQPVFGSAAKARARDEDKREKPAAVAAATTRQEQPAAFKPAPVSVAPFRCVRQVTTGLVCAQALWSQVSLLVVCSCPLCTPLHSVPGM